MFDPTGVLEVFISRFDTHVPNPRYDLSPPPLCSAEHDEYAVRLPTQEHFHVVAYLTERFDWMGEEALCVTFAIDEASTPTTQYIRVSDSVCLPRQECGNEKLSSQMSDFASLQRLQTISATLEPLNATGWPLEAQESGQGQITIKLVRGNYTTNTYDSNQFLRAGGPAGCPVAVTFNYASQSRGIISLSCPSTLVSTDNLMLALGRTPQFSRKRRHPHAPFDPSSRLKRATVEEGHHPLPRGGATSHDFLSLILPQETLPGSEL